MYALFVMLLYDTFKFANKIFSTSKLVYVVYFSSLFVNYIYI